MDNEFAGGGYQGSRIIYYLRPCGLYVGWSALFDYCRLCPFPKWWDVWWHLCHVVWYMAVCTPFLAPAVVAECMFSLSQDLSFFFFIRCSGSDLSSPKHFFCCRMYLLSSRICWTAVIISKEKQINCSKTTHCIRGGRYRYFLILSNFFWNIMITTKSFDEVGVGLVSRDEDDREPLRQRIEDRSTENEYLHLM